MKNEQIKTSKLNARIFKIKNVFYMYFCVSTSVTSLITRGEIKEIMPRFPTSKKSCRASRHQRNRAALPAVLNDVNRLVNITA